MVFQSAKLASHLLRAARTATGEAGWDCLVAGEVVGDFRFWAWNRAENAEFITPGGTKAHRGNHGISHRAGWTQAAEERVVLDPMDLNVLRLLRRRPAS